MTNGIRTIKTVEQIEQARTTYIQWLKANPMEDGQLRPKTLQRFVCFLDIDIANLYDYINGNHSVKPDDRDTYEQLRQALKKKYDEILGDKVEKLETMKTTPVGLIFSMKNSFNRADRNEYNIRANVSIDKVLDDIIQ